MYANAALANRVLQLIMTSPTPIQTIANGLSNPYSVFVTADDNVFVNNYGSGNAVTIWAPNATTGVLLMALNSSCYSLFVDINSTLYCSLDLGHAVLTISLSAGTNATTVVAGTGIAGSAATQLYGPYGTYVDTGFNLYIADCNNHRIQFLKPTQLSGTTVAGTGAPGTIPLSYPSSVMADGNGYLFIVDNGNNRLVGSGPNGFRCIAACSGQSGPSASQLYSPRSLAFDADGNLFIADHGNGRIQKFLLASNSCGKCTRRRHTQHLE